ncbi:hypothetical protein M758_10G085300 [Ceratodon purpureus]|nr:hypothetical protein M758_10G085300 [Ceratodon purpureus]
MSKMSWESGVHIRNARVYDPYLMSGNSPTLEYKSRCVIVIPHTAECSAQSELFFRLLLKNTVRWAHRPAYPNFWIAPSGAQPTSKPNPDSFNLQQRREVRLYIYQSDCGE